MISDTLENVGLYSSCPALAESFAFMRSLRADAPEGKTVLRGDDIYVNISSYKTRPLAETIFEAHRKYIDIQMLLLGEEGIAWAPLASLKVKEAYSEERDVELLLQPPDPMLIWLRPGLFTVLFPHDAHMPQVAAGVPFEVKKVVVKIRASLVSPGT